MNDDAAGAPRELSERVAVLEQIARDTRETLLRLDAKLHRLDDKLDRRFDSISAELWRNFRWLLGIMRSAPSPARCWQWPMVSNGCNPPPFPPEIPDG